MACYWSGEQRFTTIESTYVQRTRSLLANSLGDSTISKTQWLQASGLLAYYLACRSRLLEARQEASRAFTSQASPSELTFWRRLVQLSGTIPLLLRCGFHKIQSSTWEPSSNRQPSEEPQPTEPFLLPPQGTIDVGERICTFWMVRMECTLRQDGMTDSHSGRYSTMI